MFSGRSFKQTRIAPTPSGYLHAGNALNFLLTAGLAKQCGAEVLLRIDDLDRERYRPAYAADIFETLPFLNIQCNKGPQSVEEFERQWSQRHRLALYNRALEKLRQGSMVFACTCSRTQTKECDCRDKELPLDAQDTSWRLITSGEAVAVKGIDDKTTAAALPVEMKNFIVRKKDGLPAYQLSSLVDDLHFGIDLIVRGQDLWASTLAQHFLAKQLGEDRFSAVCFYHHPLLKNAAGEKFSKSAGDSSVKHWREEGKTPEAFLRHIGRLLHVPSPIQNAEELLAGFFK